MAVEDSKDDGFLSEFIDDLYAEYDERLGHIRKGLLSLETFINKPLTDETLLDSILRHCHTLKGLAATVNIENAEQLIHHTESYLRTLQKNQIPLTHSGMETLFQGFKCLEQIIIAYRTKNPLPPIEEITATLTRLTETPLVVNNPPPTPIPAPVTEPPPAPNEQQPLQLWCFNFVPTLILAKKGININSIRKQLESIGEVIQAVPQMQTGGKGVSFEFLVSTRQNETLFDQWQVEGLTYHLYPSLIATAPVKTEKPVGTIPVEPDEINATLTQTNTVRVELARLDKLMQLVGELVTTRARQINHINHLRSKLPQAQWRVLQETNLTLERQLREIRENIMRVRLVQIGHAFERMKYVIRDTANTTKKQAKLTLVGQQTEVDKLIVDKMIDPLLHLVRNAVGHGIELPEQRVAKGKPAQGQITLRAYTAGDAVVIEIEDDGQGIAVNEVAQQAFAQNLIANPTHLESATLLEILCKPGFTTVKQADTTSGRGIGMDVVKNTVTELGGSITIDTHINKGTRFTIQLPLTLAIADVLIVTVAEQKFAIPQLSVREIIEVKQQTITRFEHNEIIRNRAQVVPLLRLSHLLQLPEKNQEILKVILVGGVEQMGIIVDSIVGKREIVVRALNDPLVHCPGIIGASELGDGQVILILDVGTLARLTRTATYVN